MMWCFASLVEPVKFSVYRHNFVQHLQAFFHSLIQFIVQSQLSATGDFSPKFF